MYSKKVLANGIRLITVPRPDSLSVNILVLVEAGSKYETKNQSGISHFLEHMCFKGTKKRPTALSISGELDALGAQYNAFTSQEYTGYYVTCLPDKVEQALDIISDMYLNSTFDAKEIEKEKGVIVEEINMIEDIPMRKIQDLFTKLLYGDQPAGWDVAGRVETVKKISQPDFLAYRRSHYVANKTIILVAGCLPAKTIGAQIRKCFADLSRQPGRNKLPVKEKQSRPNLLVYHKPSDQTHLVLGFRTFGIKREETYTVEVLTMILGGNMSSRLFQKIRDEMGAAYYIRAHHNSLTDHGYLDIASGVKNNKAVPALEAILRECRRLAEEEVPQTELAKAKDSLIGTTYLSLETPTDLSVYYGLQELLKREMMTPEEFAKKIKAVTAKDIKQLAKRVFTDRGLNLTILGPHKNKKKFSQVLHLYPHTN